VSGGLNWLCGEIFARVATDALEARLSPEVLAMDADELDQLAWRANQEGFNAHCSVRSYDPPVLAYACPDPIAAEKLQLQLETMGITKVAIDESNLCVVLDYRG
jgi:hypothetical protein